MHDDPARYDGNTLARAWLSVAQASGHKDDIPELAKTVHLEQYPDGLRLVATDRYMLLTSWVPADDDPGAEAPGLDVIPDRTVIACDDHGRAKSLMGYVLSLTKDEDALPLPLEVIYDVRLDIDDAESPHLEGMDPTYVVLDVPDTERVYLPVIEASFPNWRKLVDGFEPIATDAVAINPELLGRLGKVQKWTGTAPLVWRWGGPERAAAIEYGGAQPEVSGLVMPMRWVLPGEPDPEAEDDAA